MEVFGLRYFQGDSVVTSSDSQLTTHTARVDLTDRRKNRRGRWQSSRVSLDDANGGGCGFPQIPNIVPALRSARTRVCKKQCQEINSSRWPSPLALFLASRSLSQLFSFLSLHPWSLFFRLPAFPPYSLLTIPSFPLTLTCSSAVLAAPLVPFASCASAPDSTSYPGWTSPARCLPQPFLEPGGRKPEKEIGIENGVQRRLASRPGRDLQRQRL